MYPPHRFISSVRAFIDEITCSSAKAIPAANEKNRIIIVMATTTKVMKAVIAPPVTKVCPARPARIGPAQPNPERI